MWFDRWFKKGYQYANTRQFVRLPAAWPIKCEPRTKSNGKHVTATKDVSAGGVAVIMREEVPVGSRIHLEVHVPLLDRIIQAEGQVVRCLPRPREGGFELGVQFQQIDPEQQKALNDAIAQHNQSKSSSPRSFWRRGR